jgi:hypothetical protein
VTTPVGAGPNDGLAMLYSAMIKQGESDLATGQAETVAAKNARDAELQAEEAAIAQEEQAQQSSGFWGDVGGVFGAVADVAVPAGLVLTAVAPPVGAAVLVVGAVATAAGGGAHIVSAAYQHTADEAVADATEARHAVDNDVKATNEILQGAEDETNTRRDEEKTIAGAMRTNDGTLVAAATPEGGAG